MADAEWWRGAVIYQVYPRSFQDSDGDGVGDLPGITRRLGHIASLGVDAVWIAPFFKSPMADMGYDVSDYRDVDPMFGTLADFDALLTEAHRLGLRVIVDQVLSHTSDQHAWFKQSRAGRTGTKADWYVWADPKPDGTAPNNWLSVFGGPAWEWDGVRLQYYMHSFLASQPDLNLHNPEVQAELLDTVRFWLDRGVDGFRLDACNHYFHDAKLRDNPPYPKSAAHDVPETNPYGMQDHLYDKTQPENVAFLKELRKVLDRYPGSIAMGEVGDGTRSPATVGLYTAGGDKLHVCYTFDLFGPEFSGEHFRGVFAKFGAAAAQGQVCWALSNHDVMRHVSRWRKEGDPSGAVAKLAIALLGGFHGAICLYQGEELGLTEAELAFEDLRDPYGIRFWPAFKGRDGCRTPMPWEAHADHGGFSRGTPWLPVPDAHRAIAVSAQEGDPGSVLAMYRRVLALRRGNAALRAGTMDFLTAGEDLLVFVRKAEGEAMLCAYNFSREPVHWRSPSPMALGETILSFGGGVAAGAEIALPPLGFAWIRLA